MELKERTILLNNHLLRLKALYENSTPPENKKDRKFFLQVKEETSPIYEMVEKWEEQALQVVKAREVTVHPNQVNATKENMELLLMHSYYLDVRRKRYMELYRSIRYIFDQLVNELP
ncbi:DUF1798 family protein [Oceanobacillus bengalensis]|uniref:DUF1798 family protein n=1 Tax=Oceanobacillus bengalensis TaxID=1435466 RepID=A0A494YUZ3_9BACI|nr:DUF1798 family protein [Oceanobacillus bengalensis]RKQ13922.1 DUF1798 family protein [Oceanobacillus bengalensis]